MSDDITQHHLARLRAATVEKLDFTKMSYWVERNTFMAGKPYSFVGHEYQRKIMDDPSPHKVIRKCSQVGLSETALRFAAGLMGVMQNFTLIYVLPTSSFAGVYGKTRFAPIVASSPLLRSAVSDSMLDNQDVKQFGSNFMWMRGCSSENAPISVAADALVIDEKSFCTPDILEGFQSRLSHSKYRWKMELSTPTFPGDLIDTSFQQSRRHWNMCKCHMCGHSFVPSYYEHVVIPGFSGKIDEITKENIHKTLYKDAFVMCPRCGGAPSLALEHREWVVENNDEKWLANGYQVQPFDCPTVISVPYLIEASTTYSSKAKFMQFNLGLPAEDSDNGLTAEDLDKMGVEISETPFTTHVMGIDVGLTSHFVIGSLDNEGRLGIVHMERVPLSKFRERYWALKGQFRVSITVSDWQPYADLVMALSTEDANLFGAVYISRNGLELFDVKMREADPDSALLGMRQVHVNRNANFDSLLAEARAGNIWVRKTDDWPTFREHLQDMKRASATLRNGEFASQWQKSSKGRDHYHHAVGYLTIAAKMRGIASFEVMSALPGVSTFRHRPKG